MKIYTLIGGVNGAGKSSLTGSLRSERSDFGVVIDPDKLTLQCGGDEYEGGKLAVERIERALEDGVNFTQETTLSGGYPKRLCKRAKEAGYYIRLYYVGLDTAEESIRRIRNRVERGSRGRVSQWADSSCWNVSARMAQPTSYTVHLTFLPLIFGWAAFLFGQIFHCKRRRSHSGTQTRSC